MHQHEFWRPCHHLGIRVASPRGGVPLMPAHVANLLCCPFLQYRFLDRSEEIPSKKLSFKVGYFFFLHMLLCGQHLVLVANSYPSWALEGSEGQICSTE